MSSENKHPRFEAGDVAATELPGGLRELSLSSDATERTSQDYILKTTSSNGHLQPNWPVLDGGKVQQASDSMTLQKRPQPTLNSKRRPNQAQRRQMSSQLSIPVDTRPQKAVHHAMSDSFHHPPNLSSRSPRRSEARVTREGNFIPYSSQGLDRMVSHDSKFPVNQGTHLPRTPQCGPLIARQNALPSHSLDTIRTLNPGHRQPGPYFPFGRRPSDHDSQACYLQALSHQAVVANEIDVSQIAEKEAFRVLLEELCRGVIARYESECNKVHDFPSSSVQLQCFGSLASGFATITSDMDLGLFSPLSNVPLDTVDSPIPRLLERAFLDAGLGARLLSRTRVPILKVCEKPSDHLRLALLSERLKWEDTAFVKLDTNLKDLAAPTGEQHELSESSQRAVHGHGGVSGVSSSIEFELLCSAEGETKRYWLRQEPEQTLYAYHGVAKKLLRNVGTPDVTAANSSTLTARDWTNLRRVCQAFVNGLKDHSLRSRLATSPSLGFGLPETDTCHYCLFSVVSQAEGEQIRQKWEAWSSKPTLLYLEDQIKQAMMTWNNLLQSKDFGVDPVRYCRDLRQALTRLKDFSVIQVILLEQNQDEPASAYCLRAAQLYSKVLQSSTESNAAMHEEILSRYVAGISDNDTRQQVGDAIGQHRSWLSLDLAFQTHKIVQLRKDLERAVNLQLYDAKQAADIKEYLKILLQHPLQLINTWQGTTIFVIPIPPEMHGVFARIRMLEDPVELKARRKNKQRSGCLEFPPKGVGVQCDINFSAHLALHNSKLLRCYSLTDPRVKPMVLFIKHWAKMRGINSGYQGTLSSYGYVLMVLHYLVNVAQPFVCPNLQQLTPQPWSSCAGDLGHANHVGGYSIQYWSDEDAIRRLAADNQLNHNTESVGHLLRGFFEYFAQTGMMSSHSSRGFDWGREVLSLRTYGGILSKQVKEWTGAKTVFERQESGDATVPEQQATAMPAVDRAEDEQTLDRTIASTKGEHFKRIRNRYLFAIEDPFEVDHNVARTVTHHGIIAIRDEFRRAWRIIHGITLQRPHAMEDLLRDVSGEASNPGTFANLLDELHGYSRPANAT